MLKYPITYTNFDGQKVTEDFYFNLTKAELMKMELSMKDGFAKTITQAVENNNMPVVLEAFDKLVLGAYGVKSEDGKHFLKTDPTTGIRYADLFKDTEAYSELFMKLATDEKEAAKFINAVVPAELAEQVKTTSKTKQSAAK